MYCFTSSDEWTPNYQDTVLYHHPRIFPSALPGQPRPLSHPQRQPPVWIFSPQISLTFSRTSWKQNHSLVWGLFDSEWWDPSVSLQVSAVPFVAEGAATTVCPVSNWWAPGPFPVWSYYESSCCEHSSTSLFENKSFHFGEVGLLDHRTGVCLVLQETSRSFPKCSYHWYPHQQCMRVPVAPFLGSSWRCQSLAVLAGVWYTHCRFPSCFPDD